jgi:hypothetical protein
LVQADGPAAVQHDGRQRRSPAVAIIILPDEWVAVSHAPPPSSTGMTRCPQPLRVTDTEYPAVDGADTRFIKRGGSRPDIGHRFGNGRGRSAPRDSEGDLTKNLSVRRPAS